TFQRFRLLRSEADRVHSYVAEPNAWRRRVLGGGAIIADERHDLGHIGLVPPPFHRPPSLLRIWRTGLYAFEFEQRAAERHILLHAELSELLHAVDLRQPAHVVEEHV